MAKPANIMRPCTEPMGRGAIVWGSRLLACAWRVKARAALRDQRNPMGSDRADDARIQATIELHPKAQQDQHPQPGRTCAKKEASLRWSLQEFPTIRLFAYGMPGCISDVGEVLQEAQA